MSKKPPFALTPAEMAQAIRLAWESGVISQQEVERELGIHQSQFSKLVNGHFKQTKGHAARLFEYSSRKTTEAIVVTPSVDAEALRVKLMRCLMCAWDGTLEGAAALEAILNGAASLRRRRTQKQ